MKRAVTVLAAAALAALPMTGTALADASGGGANNVVNVVNTAGTMLRDHTQIAFFGGPNAQSSNVAVALSQNCTGCHTRAVAVQELIITGDPSVFRPSNAATAVNAACDGCDTVAYAWQNIVQSSQGAHLTPDAQAQAAAIKDQIDAVTSDLTISDVPHVGTDGHLHSDLTNRLDALARQLDAVVSDGLISAGSGVIAAAGDRQVQLGDQ